LAQLAVQRQCSCESTLILANSVTTGFILLDKLKND
jgi:hypothetical protein